MSWQEVDAALAELAYKIKPKPDVIVGIARGGLVPARILASKLDSRDMYCLTIKKVGGERKVTTDILDDISSKTILLVEDMLETGRSLVVAQRYLEAKGAIVITAALYAQPDSEIMPDFYLEARAQVPAFPWE